MNEQINIRLPGSLVKSAEKYAELHHYRNIQELAAIAIREKIDEKDYDENFTEKEIELIDKLIEISISKRKLHNEKDIMKALE